MKTLRSDVILTCLLLLATAMPVSAQADTALRATPVSNPDARVVSIAASHNESPHGPLDWCYVYSLSPDGRVFISVDDRGQQCMRDVASGRTLMELPKDTVEDIFSLDGTTLACRQFRKCWHVYAIADGEEVSEIGELAESEAATWENMCSSPDGKRMAGVPLERQSDLKLWDAAGKLVALLPFEKHRDALNMLFSPDGKILATFGTADEVSLWNVPTLGPLRTMSLYPNRSITRGAESLRPGEAGIIGPVTDKASVNAAMFSPNGELLLVNGTENGKRGYDDFGRPVAWLFRVATGELVVQANLLYKPGLRQQGALFVRDGKVFVTASDKAVQAWSSTSGKLMANLAGARTPVAASPDGKMLAAVHGDDICLYDTTQWSQRVVIPHGAGDLDNNLRGGTPLSFSTDGRTLAHAQFFVVSTYEIPSGKLKSEYKATQPMPWHAGIE